MITRFVIQTEDGDRLASQEAFIMHPARDPDCTLSEDDVIELKARGRNVVEIFLQEALIRWLRY